MRFIKSALLFYDYELQNSMSEEHKIFIVCAVTDGAWSSTYCNVSALFLVKFEHMNMLMNLRIPY